MGKDKKKLSRWEQHIKDKRDAVLFCNRLEKHLKSFNHRDKDLYEDLLSKIDSWKKEAQGWIDKDGNT